MNRAFPPTMTAQLRINSERSESFGSSACQGDDLAVDIPWGPLGSPGAVPCLCKRRLALVMPQPPGLVGHSWAVRGPWGPLDLQDKSRRLCTTCSTPAINRR